MSIIGIDAGSSIIKIAEIDSSENIVNSMMLEKMPIMDALKKFIIDKKINKEKIGKIVLTGVGTDEIQENIYGIQTNKVNEFDAIGKGGLCLANVEEALVVNIGTGTAFVRANKDKYEHIGGTGVGGGTLVGLCKQLAGINEFKDIIELIEKGSLEKVDLTIKDITTKEMHNLPKDITSSNFGKINNEAKKEDIVLGVANMIFETIGMMAVFATKDSKNKNIVIVGNLATIPFINTALKKIKQMHNVNFIIPKYAEFANVIGAIKLIK